MTRTDYTTRAANPNPGEAFLAALRGKVKSEVFNTWFRPLSVLGCDEASKSLRLSLPNLVLRDWILSHYSKDLEAALQDIGLSDHRIEWIVVSPGLHSDGSISMGLLELPSEESLDAKVTPVTKVAEAKPEGPASYQYLSPKYTFENFVVGSSNQFAHAASQAVAGAPGQTYNPLFIYGGVGLGKTHLIQAIGHSIKQSDKSLVVAYVSLERFMNELINAIRYGYDKTNAFRERYRTIDVLLMDDIQFIAGKERTQEEFFHTFNALYESQKQIVISSDSPPREIRDIEERLHSRFEWGLIADIEPPDLETKVAILRRKASLHGFTLPDEVALYIAGAVKRNIRELEGSLLRLLAFSSLRGLPITKMLAEDAVGYVVDANDHHLSISKVQRVVAAHYKMKVEDLTAKSNARSIAVPRQVAMYLSKRLTKQSYPEIGRQFGGKHHTTVIHSVEKVEKLIGSNPDFHRVVNGLVETLRH
jgi:chromosomal replication initiator protein